MRILPGQFQVNGSRFGPELNNRVIRLLAEELDRVRTIHLRGPTGEVTPSPLGHSVGYWEDRSLIVNTTHINSMSFNDPVNYTETFTFGRRFVWAPDEAIRPWNCVDLGVKDMPPDLDELTRMLEEL